MDLLDSLAMRLSKKARDKLTLNNNLTQIERLESELEVNIIKAGELSEVEHVIARQQAQLKQHNIWLMSVKKLISNLTYELDRSNASLFTGEFSTQLEQKGQKLKILQDEKEVRLQACNNGIQFEELEKTAQEVQALKKTLVALEADIGYYDGMPANVADAEQAVEQITEEIRKLKTNVENHLAASVNFFNINK